MISAKINVPLVYGTGVINAGAVPSMRASGLAGQLGFDPTAYAADQSAGMTTPPMMNTPSMALRVLTNRGNNWMGRR